MLGRAAPGLIAVAALVAFLPALDNGFVEWDDHINFLHNRAYRGLSPRHLHWMFTTFYTGHYIPLTWMTLGLDYLLWGMEPFGYHLTNLVLHAANAALFYCLAWRLIATAAPAMAGRPLAGHVGAALAAVVFALHPLRVESVAWVTERRDVVSGFFYLAAVLAYLRTREAGAVHHRRWYWLAVGCGVLALLSKSIAVSLPVVLLVIDVYPLRRLADAPRGKRWRALGSMVVEKVPFVLASGAIAALTLRHAVVFREVSMRTLSEVGPLDRLAVSLYGLAFYLGKLFTPWALSPLYPLPRPIEPLSPPFVLAAIIVIAITVLAVRLWRRFPALLACWVAYGVTLFPVAGVFMNGPQIAADRYTYLSCMSWAVLAGGLAATWLQRSPVRRALEAAVLTAGLGVALGILTWQQTKIWRDTERLWTHALSVVESYDAHVKLAGVLERRGTVTAADPHYRAAIRLRPGEGHNELGVALLQRGDRAGAIRELREGLRAHPDLAEARANLGFALYLEEDLDGAVAELRRALALKPTLVHAHDTLGHALSRRGEVAAGAEHLSQAARLRARRVEGLGW